MVLPDQVAGPRAEQVDPKVDGKSLVASPDEYSLIEGLSPYFHATNAAYYHVHVDLALNRKRHGDAAGIAMGRVVSYFKEVSQDPLMNNYERIVRHFEVPLVAQIVAPVGGQIYIGSVTRFILQLKSLRGFNITSFSFDGFQSADAMQQLALAGLVTAGMSIDPLTGEVTGMPIPFRVDGTAVQPYRELLEGCNERRIGLPRYAQLRKELRELEVTAPGRAPDHPLSGTKDVADPVAGVIGYLSAHGHAELASGEQQTYDRRDLAEAYDLPEGQDFTIDDNAMDWESSDQEVGFGIE